MEGLAQTDKETGKGRISVRVLLAFYSGPTPILLASCPRPAPVLLR
jgi:hypothetical protein